MRTIQELLTVPALIAWLKEQPADKKYIYNSGDDCLLTRYLCANGHECIVMHQSIEGISVPQPIQEISVYGGFITPPGGSYTDMYASWETPRTYGGALEAALKLQKEPA